MSLQNLGELLSELGISSPGLAEETFAGLDAKLEEGRPALLSHLKSAGVESLSERQKIANGFSKAKKTGRLGLASTGTPPPPATASQSAPPGAALVAALPPAPARARRLRVLGLHALYAAPGLNHDSTRVIH